MKSAYIFMVFMSLTVLVRSQESDSVDATKKNFVVALEPIELDGSFLLRNHILVQKVAEVTDLKELFSYEEVLKMQSAEMVLPSLEELTTFLNRAGFNVKDRIGFVPDAYYQLGLNYPGIKDPVSGLTHQGEKLGLWFKETDTGLNYLTISKNELSYSLGRIHPKSKISVRYIAKK